MSEPSVKQSSATPDHTLQPSGSQPPGVVATTISSGAESKSLVSAAAAESAPAPLNPSFNQALLFPLFQHDPLCPLADNISLSLPCGSSSELTNEIQRLAQCCSQVVSGSVRVTYVNERDSLANAIYHVLMCWYLQEQWNVRYGDDLFRLVDATKKLLLRKMFTRNQCVDLNQAVDEWEDQLDELKETDLDTKQVYIEMAIGQGKDVTALAQKHQADRRSLKREQAATQAYRARRCRAQRSLV